MTDKTDSKERGSIISSSDILLHDAETALMYEELRAAIDDGHESMTHADALAEIAAIRAENVELRAQLEAIGAGGVSGPLMGKPQEMPDLSALTERGAKAWAGVDAQGLRDGVASLAASAGSEPVAYAMFADNGNIRLWSKAWIPHPDAKPLYLHPSPPEGMVAAQALRKVLSVVQRYLPPDGPTAHDAMTEITEIVDPWPLGPLEKP